MLHLDPAYEKAAAGVITESGCGLGRDNLRLPFGMIRSFPISDSLLGLRGTLPCRNKLPVPRFSDSRLPVVQIKSLKIFRRKI